MRLGYGEILVILVLALVFGLHDADLLHQQDVRGQHLVAGSTESVAACCRGSSPILGFLRLGLS